MTVGWKLAGIVILIMMVIMFERTVIGDGCIERFGMMVMRYQVVSQVYCKTDGKNYGYMFVHLHS